MNRLRPEGSTNAEHFASYIIRPVGLRAPSQGRGEEYRFSLVYVLVSSFNLRMAQWLTSTSCQPYEMTECPNPKKLPKYWSF